MHPYIQVYNILTTSEAFFQSHLIALLETKRSQVTMDNEFLYTNIYKYIDMYLYTGQSFNVPIDFLVNFNRTILRSFTYPYGLQCEIQRQLNTAWFCSFLHIFFLHQ